MTDSSGPTTGPKETPSGPTRTVPVRHPGRWVATGVILVLVAMLVNTLLFSHVTRGGVQEGRFQWGVVWKYLFVTPVLRGIVVTLELTAIAMVVGIVLGVVLAVMRLSPNRLLSGAAWIYIWFFRGTPVLVQLIFWYVGITYLYPQLTLGVPFGPAFYTINANTLVTSFIAAALGLSLNEGAYMAEIVRAGIISVDEGQTEAAQSLGMSKATTLRRIVLPQAMRIIIPPTGNETISMLKTTSLVIVIAGSDLFTATQNISNTNYQIVPLLLVASLWYLFFTSVLTIGQFYVERYYARGPPGPFPPPPSSGSARTSSASVPSRSPSDRSAAVRTPAPPCPRTMRRRCDRADGARPGVRKSFGRLEVLQGIDLTVDHGEVLCLIGPSGSGKSTFLRCINHLEKIDGGELSVDGDLVGYRRHGDKLYELRGPRGVRQAGRDRHGLPAVQPLPPHERAGQRDLRAGAGQEGASGPGQGAGPRAPRPGRPGRQGRRATPTSSPGASSSGWPSPGPWPWSPS